MSFFKHAIAGLVVAGSLASSAFAQGEIPDQQTLGNNTMTFVTPSGSLTKKTLTSQQVTELMKNGAQPMTSGVITMMHNGKMYMMTDHKMPDGTMMSGAVMGTTK